LIEETQKHPWLAPFLMLVNQIHLPKLKYIFHCRILAPFWLKGERKWGKKKREREEEYKDFTWELGGVVIVYINHWDNTIHVISFSFEFIMKIERNQLLFCRVETITWWHNFHLSITLSYTCILSHRYVPYQQGENLFSSLLV